MWKSRIAFEMSAQKLSKESKQLYFWSFTFRSVPFSDDSAMEDCDALNKRLHKRFPDLRGLRVCELHRSHGIHFHCLVNQWVNVNEVRALIRGTGRLNGRNRYLDFGRFTFKKADENAVRYLSKYMTKDYRKRFGFGRRRRWGAMGGFVPVRKSDLEWDTAETRNRSELFGTARCSFVTFRMICKFTLLWGHWRNWPGKDLRLVLDQSGTSGTGNFLDGQANCPF